MGRVAPWLLLVTLVACGDDLTSDPPVPGTGGAGGESSCPLGSTSEGTLCVPAGVKTCAEGFEPNGRGGCRAVLPVDPCPQGQVALPGESRCRPVGDDCGPAPWGNIPVEPSTHYVDASYRGLDSDGSAAKPWQTIQQGVNAATEAVAIAAGTYRESLIFAGKPLRLWGRCPALVTIESEPGWEAVSIDAPLEVHNLALTGTVGAGVYYAGGEVLLEDVWIHDVESEGILAIGDSLNGATRITLRDSLVEGAAGAALLLVHTDVVVERSVVRDVGGSSLAGAGRGIHLETDALESLVPTLTVTSSIVERTREVGIVVDGGALALVASLVRDTAPHTDGRRGVGVSVQHTSAPGVIDGSVIERNVTFGLVVARAEASVTGTTIEEVAVQALDGDFGDALVLVGDVPGTRLSIEDSRVASSGRAGIASFSAAVVLRGIALECNPFHLDGESPYGAFAFDDAGQNVCWCGDEAADCKVLSAGIQPPTALR